MFKGNTELKSLLAKSTINLSTTTIGGDPVSFTLKVLSGDALLQARKLVLERDERMAGNAADLTPEELNNVLDSGMKMMAKVAQLVLVFDDEADPTVPQMEQVLTLTGGMDGELAATILKCIGLGGSVAQPDRNSLDELPT